MKYGIFVFILVFVFGAVSTSAFDLKNNQRDERDLPSRSKRFHPQCSMTLTSTSKSSLPRRKGMRNRKNAREKKKKLRITKLSR